SAVTGFLTSGVRQITLVGQTLAETRGFALDAPPEADDERLRQLSALLDRHPNAAAVYVGYRDGRFFFAARSAAFSPGLLGSLGVPPGPAVILRVVDGEGAERRDRWWFQTSGGGRSPLSMRAAAFDPRERPWYVLTQRLRGPALTEPYRFASSNEAGIS